MGQQAMNEQRERPANPPDKERVQVSSERTREKSGKTLIEWQENEDLEVDEGLENDKSKPSGLNHRY
jgi:hypothetical protein